MHPHTWRAGAGIQHVWPSGCGHPNVARKALVVQAKYSWLTPTKVYARVRDVMWMSMAELGKHSVNRNDAGYDRFLWL